MKPHMFAAPQPVESCGSFGRILVVDQENRLHSREVEILRIDRDDVLVKGPLPPGERICVSPLQVVVEGMQVRTVEDAAQPETDRS